MGMDRAVVIGIDPSLTATGVSTGLTSSTLKPGKLTGLPRMRAIVQSLGLTIVNANPDMVVIEGPSFASKAASSAHERAGLWWKIADMVDMQGCPLVVVPPATLKKYATGKGNADKDAVVLATARRFAWFEGDNNAADATWLAAIGHDLAGHPIVTMPELNRSALTGVSTREPTS